MVNKQELVWAPPDDFEPSDEYAQGGIIPGTIDAELEIGEVIMPTEDLRRLLQAAENKQITTMPQRAVLIIGRGNGSTLGSLAAAALTEILYKAAETIRETLDTLVDLINEAWGPAVHTIEEITKLMEECDPVDDPQEEDRHDGATMILTIWLPPVPTLKKLYGQGVDYGGLAHPSGADPPRR